MNNANATGFYQKDIARAGRVVRITANDNSGPFTCRLYVNGGETATMVKCVAKTASAAVVKANAMLVVAMEKSL